MYIEVFLGAIPACILEFIATSKCFLIIIRAFHCAVNIGRMTIEGLDFEAEPEHKDNT